MLSAGRVEVGIGTGSHYLARYDDDVIGIRFPAFPSGSPTRCVLSRPSCPLARRTGHGRGEWAEGRFARPPRNHTAPDRGRREVRASARIAVSYADGWHAPGMEPSEFAEIARRLDRVCEEGDRPALRKGVQLRADDPFRSKEQVERLPAFVSARRRTPIANATNPSRMESPRSPAARGVLPR